MTTYQTPPPASALDEFVAALIDWGATASQIVGHMDAVARARPAESERSPVDIFRELVTDTIGLPLEGRDDDLQRAAALIALADREVGENILMVPLDAPREHPRARRRPRR